MIVQPVTGQSYYRIQIVDHEYHNYSRIILLSVDEIALNISGLVNPFDNSISFNMTVPEDHTIQLGLYDALWKKTDDQSPNGLQRNQSY